MIDRVKAFNAALKGFRTLLTNGLFVVAGVVAYLDAPALGHILPPRYAWVPIAIGAANVALRMVTTGPVGRK